MTLAEADIFLLCDVPGQVETVSETIRQATGRKDILVAINVVTGLQLLNISSCEYVFVYLQAGPLASTYFLNEVWKVYPKTVRFVLADSIDDPEALARCVLGAHQFIPTPVTAEAVSLAMARADAVKDIVRNERIQSLVSQMRTLPSRPTFYTEVMREIRSSAANARSVAEIVSKDLAISTKLLQLANSASLGQFSQISDPATAVLLLGLETTAALVVSIESFARFDKVKPLYFSIDQVWKHSQSVAILTRAICERMGCDRETAANAYTAGLLHDIGKLVFAQNFEEQYQRKVRAAEEGNVPQHELENEAFGANHAEAGAYLLAVWGLPLPIVHAVAKHHLHASRLAPPFDAATGLHIAEQLLSNKKTPDDVLGSYSTEFDLLTRLADLPMVAAARSAASRQGPAAAVTPEEVRPFEPSNPTAPSKEYGIKYGIFACASLVVVASVGVFLILSRKVPAPVESRTREDFYRRSEPQVGQTAAKAAAPKQGVRLLASSAAREAKETVDAENSSAPNPVPEPKPADLKLHAIMYNGAKSRAVINGRVYQIGDTVERHLVISITPQNVTLKEGTILKTLALR